VKYPGAFLQKAQGPLVAYIDLFAEVLHERGYRDRWARRQILLIHDFSRWLKQKGIALHDITLEHTARYLRHRAHYRRPNEGDRSALRRFLSVLRQRGVIAEEPTVKVTPVEKCVIEFAMYLRQERTLATHSIENYVPFIRAFLSQHFNAEPVQLGRLRAADVVGFVQREAPRLRVKRAKLMTTALRSFLRYARYRGEISHDLANAVPTVANWTMASIPRAIAPEHIRAILKHCDRQSALGRREYAILLLLARLGLRAGEIAALTLEDLNWKDGCISVSGKRDQRSELPLPMDVGEAIVDYLQNGRPCSNSRSLFLRAQAPTCGFSTHTAVSSVVRRALARAGIESRPPDIGP
jgi:integrase/recombinase XerD